MKLKQMEKLSKIRKKIPGSVPNTKCLKYFSEIYNETYFFMWDVTYVYLRNIYLFIYL